MFTSYVRRVIASMALTKRTARGWPVRLMYTEYRRDYENLRKNGITITDHLASEFLKHQGK